MKITAHCFAKKVRIETLPILFKYNNYDVALKSDTSGDIDGLVLEITKAIDPAEVDFSNETKDPQGAHLGNRLRLYKEALTEIAHLIESYLAIHYNFPPPRFNPEKTIVNVHPETAEERALISSGKVSGGFGDIFHDEKCPSYKWSERILPTLDAGINNLAGFSFISQAMRSQANNDQEVAFFLYFRIVEGYCSDGSTQLEQALIKNKEALKKYIIYDETIKDTLKKILSDLNLPSKSNIDFDGLISDIVLIRHKLTHFSKSNESRHHSVSINFELGNLNNYMRRASLLILSDEVGI